MEPDFYALSRAGFSKERIAENTDTSEGQTNESENPDILEEQGTKVLVAYFSATNTTQGIAEHIANGFSSGGGDLCRQK